MKVSSASHRNFKFGLQMVMDDNGDDRVDAVDGGDGDGGDGGGGDGDGGDDGDGDGDDDNCFSVYNTSLIAVPK